MLPVEKTRPTIHRKATLIKYGPKGKLRSPFPCWFYCRRNLACGFAIISSRSWGVYHMRDYVFWGLLGDGWSGRVDHGTRVVRHSIIELRTFFRLYHDEASFARE